MNIHRNFIIIMVSGLLVGVPLTAFAVIADPGFGGPTPPVAPPERTCEVEFWHGGIVVLPPHPTPPAPKNVSVSDTLRQTADRLDKLGMTFEANRLRMIAEAIETIRKQCENLGDPPLPPEDLIPIDDGIIR